MEGRCWRAAIGGGAWNRKVWSQKQEHGLLRFMTQKASNRAAVHGAKLPDNETIDEEVDERLKKGKEEKASQRKEVEKRSTPKSRATKTAISKAALNCHS